MKKIFLLVILLMTLCLVSCQNENNKIIEQTKEQLLTIIDTFGEVEDETLEYEDIGNFYGEGRVCIYTEDEKIGLMLFKDSIAILLQVDLEESARNKLKVWNVDISYIDTKNKISIELSYYHYDEPLLSFKEDYSSETFDINFIDFSKGLSLLTIEDIKEILTKLGYSEVNE